MLLASVIVREVFDFAGKNSTKGFSAFINIIT